MRQAVKVKDIHDANSMKNIYIMYLHFSCPGETFIASTTFSNVACSIAEIFVEKSLLAFWSHS